MTVGQRLIAFLYKSRFRAVARRLGLARFAGRGSLLSGTQHEVFPSNDGTVGIRLVGCTALFSVGTAQERHFLETLGGEGRVLETFLEEISPADVVLDVGANVGLYSIFTALKASDGMVIAVEPEPHSLKRLQENVELNDLGNVRTLEVALGVDGVVLHLTAAASPELGSHTVLSYSGVGTVEVTSRSGDGLLKETQMPAPNLIKIDVEGMELEVLQSLEGSLSDKRCRSVLCEVHFTRLKAMGKRSDPSRIEGLLRGCGLSDLSWIDPSHLLARRGKSESS